MGLIQQIRDAGVVGAGGAGFPTDRKLDCKAEVFIVNGIECEPLLRTDRHVMELHAPEIVRTVRAIRDHIGAKRAVIALKKHYEHAVEALSAAGVSLEGQGDVQVLEYIYDMPTVMAAADLVLCRAGASTISELTAIAKPSILVPSPNVTANHQEKNARVLSGQGAAVLLLEKDCPNMELYDQASALLRDPARRDSMIRALNSMAVPDAGEKIYQTLMGLLKK